MLFKNTHNSAFLANALLLWRLAGPLILGQVAVVGMTVTDIYMAGQVSADTLAAVQLGGSIWAVINLIVIGIMIGNSPIIGNYWGAGKHHLVRFQFQQALWLAVPMGILVNCAIIGGIFILGQLDMPVEVYDIGRSYLLPFLITGLMFPAFFAFRSTFEGIGDIRPVMVFNAAAFLLNIVLDYALVFGHFGLPAMGGVGAAWATATVMTFLLLCMAIYAHYSHTMRALKLYSQFTRANIAAIGNILKLGIPIALNISAEMVFFAIIPLLVAHLGSDVVGAHAIAINIDSLAFMIPLGVAQALTIKVAHAEGANNPKLARQICLVGFKLAFLLGLAMAVLKISLGSQFAQAFSSDPNVQMIATNLFFFAAVLGCVDCLQMSASGALRGYKDVRLPLLIQVTAFWGIAFPIAYSLALTDFWGEPLGVYGFWAGMIIGALCAGIGLLSRWNIVSRNRIYAAVNA
jgi:MATE family multidrug resistance protein